MDSRLHSEVEAMVGLAVIPDTALISFSCSDKIKLSVPSPIPTAYPFYEGLNTQEKALAFIKAFS